MNDKNGVPLGWVNIRLGEFVESQKGKKPKRTSKEKSGTYFLPYVNIQAFEKNLIDEYTDGDGCVLCEDGDFLMVWDGSRSGYTGKAISGALGSTLVKINFPGIFNDYAFYFLQSKYLEINTRAKGTGTPHVDPSLLWNYVFPIPPIKEQHRIVERIEALFSELDEGIKALKTAQEQLKVHRQAVLKDAFEGKLTAEWRANQKNLSSTGDLIKLIESEREKAEHISGKKSREVGGPDEDRLGNLSELPCSWVWIKLGKIVTKVEYGTAEKSNKEGRIPVVRMGNIKNSKISWEDLAYTDNIADIEKYKLEYDDILFNRTNSPE